MEDISKYSHSPTHYAVLCRDYAALQRIVSTLPALPKAGEVNTEVESLAAELKADAVSAVIDRRDVPGRETPLHLAVKLRDPVSAEILMGAGADCCLQNENGWSALQEAVCTREESVARIITWHYQPFAWAKWCRRLPRIVGSVARIQDFYMEISFHFESSVIPFIGRIAPSDTYRIWKRGSNLRADMTLAGFDGFRIQRAVQTCIFLGEGYLSEDGNVSLPPGSLITLAHKEKEVTNVLEGAGSQLTEAECADEVAVMSKSNMYRPSIDVTQAELVPRLNWRRQERTEVVGNWKAKVYDMHHVMVSVKSRRVPGAMTDEELFAANSEERLANGGENDEFDGLLTAEERKQLDTALRMGNTDGLGEEGEPGVVEYQGNVTGAPCKNVESNGISKEKKSWFGRKNKGSKYDNNNPEDSKILKKSLDNKKSAAGVAKEDMGGEKKGKDNAGKKKKKKDPGDETKHESEYKKGLRPVLWLTPNFPLKTEELLPLLDILANKVKAIRRLRELLTTKLPQGTFPVKVAIPIVPTVRVLITFTKFEELQPFEEFSTPPSSPPHFQDANSNEPEGSTSWISWMRAGDCDSHQNKDDIDPFLIPPDYTWIDPNEKKRRRKAKTGKCCGRCKHSCQKRASSEAQTSGL